MRRLLLLVVVLLGDNTQAGLGRGVATGGSCVDYPSEGLYCSGIVGGLSVYHFDGVGTVEERSEQLAAAVAPLETASNGVAGPDCVFHSKSLWCLMWFPKCDADQHPVLPCMEYCESVRYSECLLANQAAAAFDLEAFTVSCSETAGGPETASNNVLPDYLAGWAGEEVFRNATYVDSALPGSPTLACAGKEGDAAELCAAKLCPMPNVNVRYPLLADSSSAAGFTDFRVPEDANYCANMTSDLDCDRCFSLCEPPCKYDFLFTEGEFAAMAAVQWAPGLLALPLNCLILVSEHYRLKAMPKPDRVFTERLVYFIAVFGILLFLIDGLPALLVGEQVRCAGSHVHSVFTNVDGSDWCWFAKIKVHLLQALMFTVVATLFRLRMQLKGTLAMKGYKAPKRVRRATGFAVFVLPLLLALPTFLDESDQLYEASFAYRLAFDAENGNPVNIPKQYMTLYVSNNVRYAYSCGPKFRTITEELIVFQGPLMVAGALCLGLSISLLNIVRKMATVAFDGENTFLVRKLSVAMVRFAVINVSLVVLNTVSTAVYLPQSLQFSADLNLWGACVSTGIDFRGDVNFTGTLEDIVSVSTSLADNEANCGRLSDIAPSAGLIILVQGAQTVPPLAFGLVFAIPALRQLRALLKHKNARRNKVGPSDSGPKTPITLTSALAKPP